MVVNSSDKMYGRILWKFLPSMEIFAFMDGAIPSNAMQHTVNNTKSFDLP